MVDNELEDERRRAARSERDIRLGKKTVGKAPKGTKLKPTVTLTEDEVDVLADQPLHNPAPPTELGKAPVQWANTKWLICVREHEQAVAKVRKSCRTRADCADVLRLEARQAYWQASWRQAARPLNQAYA